MDRHEEDKKFLKGLYPKDMKEMASENIFCEWAIIDGEKPIEEVSKNIVEYIK